MKTAAIVLSAGSGKRMGLKQPKQYIKIADRPILYYPLKAFDLSAVNEVIVVAQADDIDMVWEDIIARYGIAKVSSVVAGGSERYDSVLNGIKAVDESVDVVLIHDGARPFISVDVINEMISYMETGDAAIAAMPVKDTIKLADEKGYIEDTTQRAQTWLAQTPQAFKRDMILNAYQKIAGENAADESARRSRLSRFTDDAMFFSEVYPGKKVKLIEGGYNNIKITTGDDLKLADLLMK